jgi:hypothetical protein
MSLSVEKPSSQSGKADVTNPLHPASDHRARRPRQTTRSTPALSGTFRANEQVAEQAMDSSERSAARHHDSREHRVHYHDILINIVGFPATPISAAKSSGRCRWWMA